MMNNKMKLLESSLEELKEKEEQAILEEKEKNKLNKIKKYTKN
jgi:hypothetical protein